MKPIKIKRTDKIIIGILAASITLAAILSFISRGNKNSTNVIPEREEAEYSEADRTTSMEFTWGGEAYEPVTDADDLSSTIVTQLVKDIQYSRDDKNHLKVLL